MARTFQEVELMMNAAKKYQVATQIGPKKTINNNSLANDMLIVAPPRKDWEEFCRL